MPARISLSEVLSALSYALDLTDGQPAGHTLRSCLIGMRLGRDVGFGGEQRSALYYALLLKDAGCSSNAARLTQLFGTDDRLLKPRMRDVDRHDFIELLVNTIRTVAMGRGVPDKMRHLLGLVRAGDFASEVMELRCERGADIASRLGFPQSTAEAVRHLDEHWNGKGHPQGLKGPSIPMMSRIAAIAQVADAYNHRSGMRAALKVLKQRSGSWFDPQLVNIVQGWARDPEWWAQLGGTDLTAEVMGEEPEAHARWVTDEDLDVVARAFADIIDAKSPYTYSHSRNVAAYALGIARELRLDADMQRRAYRAGLLHDIGKLGISNTILDKPAPLDATERAAVERHPFYTWEILSRVPAFRDFAWPAALHHERLDGSGYPWHLGGNRLDLIARILGVADVFEALTANRPYRSGLPWDQAWAILSQGRGRAYDGAVLDALAAFRASTPDMTVVAPLAAA